ncbi:unnamed protein product [Medioppia subpectinata]|uniref:Uncharacterized protein n=1 Tax=Medioppia subpectinata TaxID=1979941 RepID=A0A7R9KCS1_9ACAR|nr:unnamed protein product [Medioppia subpectinata]CAG2100824.1 unnamed protein product [Medioppia subpectinata]
MASRPGVGCGRRGRDGQVASGGGGGAPPETSCCNLRTISWDHKYIALCLLCGTVSTLIGSLIVIIYAMIRSNTSSLQYFETIPSYIVAILLIFNGESGRWSLFGDPKPLTTLLTVVLTRVGHHMTFDEIMDCDVVHGLLFSCLRGLFGLSVFAILMCIFSLMLVYQLLSHQKKKKYLQQLELRRRFAVQSRGFGGNHSSAYVSTHVSPIILSQNTHRNHSLRHLPYGSYGEDLSPNGWCLPPHSYDYLDSRSHNRHFDDEIRSNVGIMSNTRSNSWTNWLNWPRSQIWSSNNHHVSNQNTNRGFFADLFRRHNKTSDRNCSHQIWRHPSGQNFLPPHVFIPRIGSGGLSPLPQHLLRYHRDSHLRPSVMRAMSSAHRRTRSNDGIFQHMNVQHMSIDPAFSAGTATVANTNTTNMFAIWGPPPPYTCSQPQSLNRINTICNNMNHSSGGQHCRQASVHSSDVTPTSKMSTPLSERRLRCNAFSSQGIRLTIEANDQLITSPESKSSCIVEIHVPYSEDHPNHDMNVLDHLKSGHKKSQNLSFNTMPSMKRSDHLQPINPFKSLSNIPIVFPANSPKNSGFTDSELESNKSKLETIQHVYRSQVFDPKSLSNSSSTPMSTTRTTTELSSELSTYNHITDESFSADSFPVDPPTDYKSTLIIQTPNTQSSPLTDDKSSTNVAQRHAINGSKEMDNLRLNSAQSMPNLSCIIPISSSKSTTSTRTQPNFWELYRIPSSGNTSTSQDLADFELDLDEESIKMAADLPNDYPMKATMKASTDLSPAKSSSEGTTTASLTPELLKPPTPFNNQNFSDKTQSTSSTATLSSLSEPKAELIINIKGIQSITI